MRIHIIAVGTRMPGWVASGYKDFARRMPPELGLVLVEIPLGKRARQVNVGRAMEEEGKRMLAAIPRGALVIGMEVDGCQWSTRQLAEKLQDWFQNSRDVALLVGGPDGLSAACRERADISWSLSPLTFPHALVRVVLAEQLYRAAMIVRGHPYHRG